jgi:hypothetical protein
MEELLKIFESSKRKKYKVDQAIVNGTWIANIIIGNTFSEVHLAQFIELWLLVNDVQLHTGVEDSIVWKLTANGQYSAASAYKLQFLGLVQSAMNTIMWKAWATPKAKHHAWLAFQNRLWTADRLEKRGWANCGLARFASKQQSQRIIFLSIVVSPLDFGSSSKIGLGSKVSIQEIGHPSL